MPDEFQLGMDAKIYYGPYAETPLDLSALTEMSNVRDVTLNLGSAQADHTTRANQGWRAQARTLRECTVEWEMVWRPGDAGFEAVRDAYLATNGLLHLAILDRAREEDAAEGIDADFSITQFNRTEPIEDVIKVAVTATLSRYISWIEVSAS